MPTLMTCIEEIEAHLQFLADWQTGAIGRDAFDRQEQVSAPDFTVVWPNGTVSNRQEVIAAIRDSYGTYGPRGFSSEVGEVEMIARIDDHALVRYDELQLRGDERETIRCTALFRDNVNAPLGVVWVTVHETLVTTGES